MLTRIRARRAIVLACVAVLSLAAFTAVAVAAHSHSARKSVTLVQGQTKTVNVRYPFALKFAGAKYRCTAVVSGAARRKVRILSRGSAVGGTVCRVKAKNTSRISGLDGVAKLTVIATTIH
jgi:hypothetical protein